MLKWKIHILMAEQRLSQKDVCDKTGVARSVMGKYYHGTIQRINSEHIEAFCKLFNCNIQDLIEYIPEEEAE